MRVFHLANAMRNRGHLAAKLDPLRGKQSSDLAPSGGVFFFVCFFLCFFFGALPWAVFSFFLGGVLGDFWLILDVLN